MAHTVTFNIAVGEIRLMLWSWPSANAEHSALHLRALPDLLLTFFCVC